MSGYKTSHKMFLLFHNTIYTLIEYFDFNLDISNNYSIDFSSLNGGNYLNQGRGVEISLPQFSKRTAEGDKVHIWVLLD